MKDCKWKAILCQVATDHNYNMGEPMHKQIIGGVILASLLGSSAEAQTCPYTFRTLSIGTLAKASDIMDNYNYILQCRMFSGNMLLTSGSYNAGYYVGDSTNWGLSVSNSGANYYTNILFGGTGDNNRAIRFIDAGNERMRINGAGYVGIGTSSPGYLLHVEGTAYAAGAAGALSDLRHKKDVVALRDGALDRVMQLRPVSYQWRKPTDAGMSGTQMGFIAQDVEKVLPSIVLTQNDKDRTKGLKYNEFIPVLTKALQELKAANDQQARQIRELVAENVSLKRENLVILSRLAGVERQIQPRMTTEERRLQHASLK